MKEKLLELTQFNGLYDHWKNLVSQLDKKDVNIIVTDLDDTIFSRKEQLEGSEELRKNRGVNGNIKIINEIGIKNYIDTWVKSKDYPKNIISLLNKKTDVIITAGFIEIQKMKVQQLGISDYKMIVVDEGKDKIISTIQYIIYDLGFIPSSITIYEDRPEFFVKYRYLLSTILGTKIIINKVHMNSNYVDAEIIEIK